MKINNFRGDLTDISAKKKALVAITKNHVLTFGTEGMLNLCSITSKLSASKQTVHNVNIQQWYCVISGLVDINSESPGVQDSRQLMLYRVFWYSKNWLGHPKKYWYIW